MQSSWLLLLALVFLSSLQCESLQCHEDDTEPADSKDYSLQTCEEGTDFCAVLSNTKTNEVFHACATKKMCQRTGNFEYQQHEELRIRCCDTEGCNNSLMASLSFGVLSLSAMLTLLRY